MWKEGRAPYRCALSDTVVNVGERQWCTVRLLSQERQVLKLRDDAGHLHEWQLLSVDLEQVPQAQRTSWAAGYLFSQMSQEAVGR